MVSFNCEVCNDVVTKPKVLAHMNKCWGPVSCIDCSKVFNWETVASHVTCISEADKYGKQTAGSGPANIYRAQGEKPKKMTAQDVWTLVVESAAEDADSADPKIKRYLPKLAELNNTPRKEKQFKNFIKNSLKLWDDSTISALWQFLHSRWEAETAKNAAAQPAKKEKEVSKDEEDCDSDAEPSTKKKGRKNDDDSDDEPSIKKKRAREEPAEVQAEPADKPLKWKKTMKAVLKSLGDDVSVADMKKAFVDACSDNGGSTKEAQRLFDERLNDATVDVGGNGKVSLKLY